MKKRILLTIAACLVIAGCSQSTDTTNAGGQVAASYESMEAAPSDNAGGGGEDNDSESASPAQGLADDTSTGTESDYDNTPGASSYEQGSSSTDSEPDFDSDDNDHAGNTNNSGMADRETPTGSGNNSDINTPDADMSDNDTKDEDTGDDTSATDNDKDSSADKNSAKDNETNEVAPEDSDNGHDISGYGRIFFIGDSRTVDMFDGEVIEVYDKKADGIRVFAKDGVHCAYMTDVIGAYGMDEFDTIVTWLGCNDNNDVALYEQVYENLLNQGKQLVICTVGPTEDANLGEGFDASNYPNQKMVDFNQNITSWAASHNVKVIDLYTFVKNNIEISNDGIHYNPKPTTAIWNYILSNL